MKMMYLVCLIGMAIASIQTGVAQKFGYINSALLVETHPKVATANGAMEAFRDSITAPFEVKAKAFQSKYQFYVQEMQAGTMSRVTAQTREQELRTEQEALGKEEQQLQFAIMQRRELLLQPILADLDGIIKTVAKEGNYTMIFDKSANGVLLYAVEGDDLTETIRGRCK